jgi:hypothetical protein
MVAQTLSGGIREPTDPGADTTQRHSHTEAAKPATGRLDVSTPVAARPASVQE